MQKENHSFRWGIIGCGLIAPKFFHALEATGEGVVVAVASQSGRRARRLGRELGVRHIYSSYEQMLDREQLDAVYVATSHNFHAANARLCLERGIPVLVEKAFAYTAKEAEGVIALAREMPCFLMEAMWMRFNPATVELLKQLEEGVIGDVRTLRVEFCVRMNPLSWKMMPWNRMYSPRLAGGALLDLGVYPIALARMLFGGDPVSIESTVQRAWTGVDAASTYTFSYADGRRAELRASFVEQRPREAWIEGTDGRICMPQFNGAYGFEIHRSRGEVEQVECEPAGFEHEIREVHRCLRSGLAESPMMSLDETLAVMRTMDDVRERW